MATFMKIVAHLSDLPIAHPNLIWDDIATALVAVLGDRRRRSSFNFDLAISEVPGCQDDLLQMSIVAEGTTKGRVQRLRRTYEPSRLVELAAVAIAGLGLYHAGDHRIHDVAVRGTGADYLVDDEDYLLEIAGRSRRVDLASAWKQRWERLTETTDRGFFVSVAEFETPAGQLAFHD